MSLDFGSVALPSQHEEDEYDPEDYAREQELHRLLTDLPDDMLEDSRDCSSPELDYSPHIEDDHVPDHEHDRDTASRPLHRWEQQADWAGLQGVDALEENYEDSYNRKECTYENGTEHIDHLQGHLHAHTGQKYANSNGGYTYPSLDKEESAISRGFSPEDDYQHNPYQVHPGAEYHQPAGQEEDLDYGEQTDTRQPFQNFESDRAGESVPDHYQAQYQPYPPSSQPRMFNPEAPRHDGHFNQLQRQFLDSAQSSAENQQMAQLQILNKAQSRQIEELEQKLDNCRRKTRYFEHQLAIMKDEKEGLAVSLRESSRVVEESKEHEAQLQGKISALELQVQTLIDREHESVRKQRVAEATVDSVKQQMAELCRSDALSRAREQHNRDLAAIREQHESRVLALQQKLDSNAQALEEQTELCQKLREQVKKLELEREEEKLERAGIINTLTQRLEESQQQCTKLLQTGTVQEMNQMRIQLQQAQSLKNISDNMNKSLREELADLQEQITLYESGVKFGVISLDFSGELENQLSDSYVALGIKTAKWHNGRIHSGPLPAAADGNLLKDELVAELKGELQRFLGSLKGKRQKISQLQEDLCQTRAEAQELRTQLDRAERNVRDLKLRDSSLEKQMEASGAEGSPQEELQRLQKERQQLKDCVEKLEKQNVELRLSEERVKAANLELCTKMREMIQEFDEEKQEAAERYERTQQQYRDDVVNHVREELSHEHAAQLEELTAEHQLKTQQLESQLAEVSKEILGVQECYIAVCREKDVLEENLRSRLEEERKYREEELMSRMCGETRKALQELKADLEKQHETSLTAARARWAEEKEVEFQEQVQAQLALAKTSWQEEHGKAMQVALKQVEEKWAQRLEEAQGGETQEKSSQTDGASTRGCYMEELEAQLASQRTELQQEADKAKAHLRHELQDKHLKDVERKVESAVSNAKSQWLQEMTSLPQYKASLQAEREAWAKQQDQALSQQQVSMVLTEAEEQWRQMHLQKLEELESEFGARQAELQEELQFLQRQLEQRQEEEAALLKVELARARASWGQEKQEEAARAQAQNERDYRAFLDEHRGKLEHALALAREEAELQRGELLLQKEADFQRLLRAREEEWSAQHEKEIQVEREKALAEVRAALAELQDYLLKAPDMQGWHSSTQTFSLGGEGEFKTCVLAGCRDLISKAVTQAQQDGKRNSQGKLFWVSKETQDSWEGDASQPHGSLSEKKGGPCSRSCAERVSRLQKQCQDLQRHLEKACRQLQQTVRDNKASMQHLREEHEVAIQKEKEESQRKLDEVQRSSQETSMACGDSQQCLQAGLAEMKEQYMRAVGKIRGDMLQYLHESKERAANMIRREVLRERQDTARRMRQYYLSCLQELLEDGGKSQGAEKKIINAARKLAAMAKVLETPVSKRKEGKSRAIHSRSKAEPATAADRPVKTVKSTPDQSQSSGCEVSQRNQSERSWESTDSDDRPGTGASEYDPRRGPMGVTTMGDMLHQDSKFKTWKTQEDAGSKTLSTHAHLLQGSPGGRPGCLPSLHSATEHITCNVMAANITMRTESRELFLKGGDSDQLEACYTTDFTSKPFLIEEAPVRDEGGQSSWSLVSVGRGLDSNFPSTELVKTFPKRIPPATSILDTDEDNDLHSFRIPAVANPDFNIYKEISKAASNSKAKPSPAPSSTGTAGHREPTPGSEGDRLCQFYSKSLFSKLQTCQQDSGFNSPLSLLHK
ncbi:centrosomal protein of 152 kDa isoform X1 [Megalops cyprinoides]|uniref:centrosomal protein of 152 kDa isoform X1 n=1 Tax=Megalops cyprinoides TaxID=118141 RepID=UPI001863A800|nr:centrosomal protein of 152 kDa isoform X1 [Megalops cyprinoides]